MKGDVFGFSPDIGKFVTRDGKTYSEYGHVYEADDCFRAMPCASDCHENYADWTVEQRSAQHAKNDRAREEYEKRDEAERKARKILVESARSKLSEEEFDAVLNYREEYDD